MALSEQERRLFAEIERSLTEDSAFAARVGFDAQSRRRKLLALSAFVVGLTALIGGAVATQAVFTVGVVLSVAGFAAMVAAAAIRVPPRLLARR